MDQAPFDVNDQNAKLNSPEKQRAKKGVKKSAGKLNSVTPMMEQFFEIKGVNPGYLLFYRMGDFYELFFEDAEIAAGALGIALTTRGAHMGQPIPMCGVPVRAHQEYLKKLISFGHRVAICEQLEDPAEAKKRGSKSVVKRDVVRLITPGTITEDDLLPNKTNNYLGALAMVSHGETEFALAWADISTGETFVQDIAKGQLGDQLGRLDLAELILSQKTQDALTQDALVDQPAPLSELAGHISVQDAQIFNSQDAPDILQSVFSSLDLKSFSRSAQSALGALVSYVGKTQKGAGIALRAPNVTNDAQTMQIDLATWSSLEVLTNNRGENKGSLRHAIDRCVTAAGSRLLARRLTAPLLNPATINQRLDMVEIFVNESLFGEKIFQALRGMPDITRPLTRLNLGRGGPRDLGHIARAILSAHELAEILAKTVEAPQEMKKLGQDLLNSPLDLARDILHTLIEHPPLLARDGEFVADGWNRELDTQRQLANKSRNVIARLQAQLAEETDIKPLKIKHNKVLGFFIEVPVSHGSKLLKEPFNATFIHRQTMANAMRFTTTQLGELEGQIAQAQFMALEIELSVFDKMSAQILSATDELRQAASALAQLDVSYGLAKLAADQSYCRPEIDLSLAFKIEAGRHPVVEQTLARDGETFVTNSCDLSETPPAEGGQLWLVTGPNMGGKSTFLRQNALIAILAQIGSFVPARAAHIGIVDRLFSRVGASDDIARGRSTFMVEMVETATILNRATKKSLVVLDEIGRGTATFDGLSIAWATTEALHHKNGSRALFATHFHEMTALAKLLDRVSNHTMKAREYQGEVVFLHEVAEGAADRSYGIQVARLAGLPDGVLLRAKEILTQLESQDANSAGKTLNDLPLFTSRPPPQKQKPDAIRVMVETLNPDDLTPREAIEFIYELKKAAKPDGNS